MTRLVWDADSKRLFETGVDRVVLYPKNIKTVGYANGEAWNGATKISEAPEGGETTPKYASNNVYLNLVSKEIFKGSISAFTYPDSFAECDGSAYVTGVGDTPIGVKITGQNRRPFGLAYRTLLGNDTAGTDFGYVIHLVYNATASVSSRDYETVNDTPEAIEFSWDFTTTPVPVAGYKPSSHLMIDSTKTKPQALKAIEDLLYGTDATGEPTLPTPEEVFTILGQQAG